MERGGLTKDFQNGYTSSEEKQKTYMWLEKTSQLVKSKRLINLYAWGNLQIIMVNAFLIVYSRYRTAFKCWRIEAPRLEKEQIKKLSSKLPKMARILWGLQNWPFFQTREVNLQELFLKRTELDSLHFALLLGVIMNQKIPSLREGSEENMILLFKANQCQCLVFVCSQPSDNQCLRNIYYTFLYVIHLTPLKGK